MNGPEYLRIGDAERDSVTNALHEHFAQGRLTREELDERLESTLSAKTVGDLREITRDLPGPDGPRTPAPVSWQASRGGPVDQGGPWGHHPAWHHHRHPAWQHHRRPRAPFVALFAAAMITVAFAGFAVLKFFVLAWLLMTVFQIAHRLRHRRDHRSRSPHRPGARAAGRWTPGTGA